MRTLTPELAAQFARLTLGHLGRQFPYKPDLVLGGPHDLKVPVEHHPIFHGSFDWHSCVHGWWQVLRIARLFPDLPETAEIRARAGAMLAPEKITGEVAFFERPHAVGFERPYGWAWLLALHDEAENHDAPWADALEPLGFLIGARFRNFLPKLTYPLRAGVHSNIAFALILARPWAEEKDDALYGLIGERALAWFGNDRDCQAWEPGGDEFLSPALTEALLMSRVLPAGDFAIWLAAFLPRLGEGQPTTLFTPATVSDRSDGKIAHLDGLNLSRAWCWRGIARALGEAHPLHAPALAAAEAHLDAALPWLAADYAGEHWLASFALLALSD